MRWIVTGVDEAGRSCVVDSGSQELGSGPAGSAHLVYRTAQSPPTSRPPGNALHKDLGVAPGLVELRVLRWAPNYEVSPHHTDSVDLDTVLAGSLELVLDDGAHTLETGDCAVVAGVDHSWRTGPEGCVLSVAVIGLIPRARDDRPRSLP